MELDIQTERHPTQCEITLRGEVDVYTAPKLKEKLVLQPNPHAADVEQLTRRLLIELLQQRSFLASIWL